MKKEWLLPGAIVPVDIETTALLVEALKAALAQDKTSSSRAAQQEKARLDYRNAGIVRLTLRLQETDK